jgi:hypothetical protein
MESDKVERIRSLLDNELDKVSGGDNPHPVGTHAVTGRVFRGAPNAGTPGVWGTEEGHPVHPRPEGHPTQPK